MTRLTNGLNHVAFITADMDRLIAFYERVFGADTILDEVIPMRGSTRHAFIEVGDGCILHPFEVSDSRWLETMPIFDRGRVDHIALSAASPEAFEKIRERLVSEGASDGTITDFGTVLSVFFRDPDGMEAEVAIFKEL